MKLVRFLRRRRKSDRADALLTMTVILIPLFIMVAGFVVDLTKNAYLQSSYQEQVQEATSQAVQNIDSSGNIIVTDDGSGGFESPAVQSVIDGYSKQLAPTATYNDEEKASGGQGDTSESGQFTNTGSCTTVKVNGTTYAAPYMVIKVSSARGVYGINAYTWEYDPADGISYDASQSNALDPNGDYHVVSAVVTNVSPNFFMGIFGIPCAQFTTSASSITFGTNQDLPATNGSASAPTPNYDGYGAVDDDLSVEFGSASSATLQLPAGTSVVMGVKSRDTYKTGTAPDTLTVTTVSPYLTCNYKVGQTLTEASYTATASDNYPYKWQGAVTCTTTQAVPINVVGHLAATLNQGAANGSYGVQDISTSVTVTLPSGSTDSDTSNNTDNSEDENTFGTPSVDAQGTVNGKLSVTVGSSSAGTAPIPSGTTIKFTAKSYDTYVYGAGAYQDTFALGAVPAGLSCDKTAAFLETAYTSGSGDTYPYRYQGVVTCTTTADLPVGSTLTLTATINANAAKNASGVQDVSTNVTVSAPGDVNSANNSATLQTQTTYKP